MHKWVVFVLMGFLTSVSAQAGIVYKGQGSDGIVRPNCDPTTLRESSSEIMWAVLVWKSEGFQTPDVDQVSIFRWDEYLDRVPDRVPKAYDLVVFKFPTDQEVEYGIVMEPSEAGTPVAVVHPVVEGRIIVVITVPPENIVGYLRPRRLDAKRT